MSPRALAAVDVGFSSGRVDPLVAEALTDASHAQRFAETYGGLQVKCNHRRGNGSWQIYDGSIWREDRDGMIYRLALEFVRGRQASALEIADRKLKEKVLKFTLAQESKPALDKLISLAKNFPPIADNGEGWDADPWLTGVAPQGVLDWRTGTLRPGDPADRITRTLGVRFDPTATAPRWTRFVDEIFDGDRELMGFIHRYLGYACTGFTHEQVLALFWGGGGNGKGVLMHLVAHVLGDYFANMSFSTLELKQRSTIPNDLAALDGRRLVTASESGEVRLNEPRIKALTGNDPITARYLYGEGFTFTPSAKFILATNTKPVVADNSHGFWRRLKLVPFTRCFEGSMRDEHLEDYLKAHEGPGILNWLIEGCLAWQRDGLGEPAAVRDATDEYRTDSDPLADFVAECCESSVTAVTRGSELFEAYGKWADRQRLSKLERLTAKDFGRRLAEKFSRRHTNTGKVYESVALIKSTLWG
ncbi:MAG: phage/plasmid primase, P4 family [Vicinamibacterales bacterium]